jgi:SAM-dependent methyltransferase
MTLDAARLAEFQALCGRIRGLSQVSDLLWSGGASAPVSYPDHALAMLADIEASSYWFAHRNEIIAAALRRHPPAGMLVDIGGGNGFVSLGLAKAGFSSAVIEPDHSGAATSERRGIPTIRAAFQDLEIEPGSIAAAGMFDVLEHIEDDVGALQGVHRALRPGGLAYVAVPALNALWSAQDDYSGHFRRYSTGSLQRTLHDAGFDPVFATYFFSALVPAILLFRVVPSYIGRRVEDQERRAHADHSLPRGFAGAAMRRSFKWEARRVSAGASVSFGSSCLVVARRA